MKYYLITIQYNKIAHAENRTAPKMFETLEEAEANFYSQVGSDMKNVNLGGSLNMVINSDGGVYVTKKWGFMVEEPVSEEVPVETE